MAFAEDIALIPFAPRGTNAAGFLPPMFRTIGHLMLVLEATAEETIELPDTELQGELDHAWEHWNAIPGDAPISAASRDLIRHYGTALVSARDEFTGWDHDQRIRHIRDLANRTVAVAAALDRELVGITDTDPGYTL